MLCALQIFSGGVYPPSATSLAIASSISNSFWYSFFLQMGRKKVFFSEILGLMLKTAVEGER